MIRSRIAPTPSGYLHIGNALNFILVWLWVRKAGGILRLRIDDRDTPRSRPEHMDDIFRTLEWMGIDWDEGPQTPDEEARIYSQTLRSGRYDEMTQLLIGSGEVFACACSRREIHERACACRSMRLPLDRPDTALRIATPADPISVCDVKAGSISVSLDNEMKDFVIRRRDAIPAYQLVSLTDDIDHDINLIIRGDDLLSSTAGQLYLASLLGASAFSEISFYHHPLLYNEQGHKLSKSSGSPSLKALRESGVTQAQFYMMMSDILRSKEKYTSLREMLEVEIEVLKQPSLFF